MRYIETLPLQQQQYPFQTGLHVFVYFSITRLPNLYSIDQLRCVVKPNSDIHLSTVDQDPRKLRVRAANASRELQRSALFQ